jgi:predicted nucleic acid-binding protein
MVFVDTAVWISCFRDVESVWAPALRHLIDADAAALVAPVRLELLAGASRADWAEMEEALEPLPAFTPRDATWSLVETWMARAIHGGQHFGIVDLVIGAMAAEQNGEIWSLDRDFARMAKLGFVKLFSPGETDA